MCSSKENFHPFSTRLRFRGLTTALCLRSRSIWEATTCAQLPWIPLRDLSGARVFKTQEVPLWYPLAPKHLEESSTLSASPLMNAALSMQLNTCQSIEMRHHLKNKEQELNC